MHVPAKLDFQFTTAHSCEIYGIRHPQKQHFVKATVDGYGADAAMSLVLRYVSTIPRFFNRTSKLLNMSWSNIYCNPHARFFTTLSNALETLQCVRMHAKHPGLLLLIMKFLIFPDLMDLPQSTMRQTRIFEFNNFDFELRYALNTFAGCIPITESIDQLKYIGAHVYSIDCVIRTKIVNFHMQNVSVPCCDTNKLTKLGMDLYIPILFYSAHV